MQLQSRNVFVSSSNDLYALHLRGSWNVPKWMAQLCLKSAYLQSITEHSRDPIEAFWSKLVKAISSRGVDRDLQAALSYLDQRDLLDAKERLEDYHAGKLCTTWKAVLSENIDDMRIMYKRFCKA
jgi:hypothetical protein